MKIKIGIAQIEILDGEKDINLRNAIEVLKSFSHFQTKPDIVCLPELFTSGYDLKNVNKYAEDIPGETIKKISEISKNNFIVVGSILEKENSQFYNTAFILDKNGKIIGKYQKIHLFSPMEEKQFLTAGNEIKIFELIDFNSIKIGITICYDLRFPEIFRILAIKGAQIIFVPSEFPEPKRKIWKTLLHARAIENQVFIVATNRVGKGKSDDFFGCSLISNGDFIECLGNKPELKVITIDLNSIDLIRNTLPLLKDRRSDLFKL